MDIPGIHSSQPGGYAPLKEIQQSSSTPLRNTPSTPQEVRDLIDSLMAQIMSMVNTMIPPAAYNQAVVDIIKSKIQALSAQIQAILKTSMPGVSQLSGMLDTLNSMASRFDDDNKKFDYDSFMEDGQDLREEFFSFLKAAFKEASSLPLDPRYNINLLQTMFQNFYLGKDLLGQDIMTSDGQDVTKLLSKYLPKMNIMQALAQYMKDNPDNYTTGHKISVALETELSSFKSTFAGVNADMQALAKAGFNVNITTLNTLNAAFSNINSDLTKAINIPPGDEALNKQLFINLLHDASEDLGTNFLGNVEATAISIKTALGPWGLFI